MSVLFDSVSRRPRRCMRGRTLLIFIAILFPLLNTPERTRGVTQQACSTDFTLSSSVVTDYPSIECWIAKTKAYNKAKQEVEIQRSAYVCPQACPILTEVTANHITAGPTCTPVEISPGVWRWYGAADAEGTYKCVPQ